jgi:rod shape-determining protein MreD
MRFLKVSLYILTVLVLQTVIFSRLNFMGVSPDLALVSVIIFAVLEERSPSTLFAAAISFVQDCLSVGPYLNTVFKTVISNVISGVRERFVGDEYSFAAGMVAVLTPAYVLIEGAVLYLVFQKETGFSYLIIKILVGTIYNLLLVPLLFPAVKAVVNE